MQTLERQETTERRSPAPPEPRAPQRRSGHLVTGGILVFLGIAWLIDLTEVDVAWQAMLAIALAIVGVALIVGSAGAPHGGLIALGVVMTLLLFFGAVAAPRNGAGIFGSGAGNRLEAPISVADAAAGYQLAAGQLTVDLGDLSLVAGQVVTIPVSVGAGELRVVVPSDAAIDMRIDVGVGNIDALGQSRNGLALSLDSSHSGGIEQAPLLILELSVGMGRVEVTR